jgi:hypothetical protein
MGRHDNSAVFAERQQAQSNKHSLLDDQQGYKQPLATVSANSLENQRSMRLKGAYPRPNLHAFYDASLWNLSCAYPKGLFNESWA